MNFLLQNPLWIALGLAAVPLIAHLFSRSRPKPREYPSLYLLQEAVKRVMRIREPRDRWLLLLRTLAAAALALAFLQPLLINSSTISNAGARTAILVIDRSASMNYADASRSRFGQSISAAADAIENLPGGSLANVIWIDQHPSSILPEPGGNLAFLRSALMNSQVKSEAGDPKSALSLAAEALSRVSGPKELLVFSDFQSNAWRDVNWDLPAGTFITRVNAAESPGENLALGEIEIEPSRPVALSPATIACRVRNFSNETKKVVVLAQAGDSRQQTPVEVLPWSETLARIPVTFSSPGLTPIKLSLTEDRFPGDDVRYGVVDVRGATRAIVAGSDETAKIWLRTLKALGVETRQIQPHELNSSLQADLVMISPWEGSASEAIRALALQGTTVFLHASAVVSNGTLESLINPASLASTEIVANETRMEGWKLRVANEEHPVFALFASGEYGDPVAGSVRTRLKRQLPPGWSPLVNFEDGVSAIALCEVKEGSRKGTIGLWNIDLGAADWPAKSGYVAFFGELNRFFAANKTGKISAEAIPGDSLQFSGTAGQTLEDLRLENEGGEKIELTVEGELATTTAPIVPGSYRWILGGNEVGRAAVNFPAQESDLRSLDAETLAALPGSTASVASVGAATNSEGKPLWPWCVGLAALCLLAEGVLMFFGPDRKGAAASAGG